MAAAPSFPSMRHRVSDRVLRIWFRSISSRVFMPTERGRDEISSLSANCRTGPGHRITARSMILSSSRMFPGPGVILEGLHRFLLDRGDLFPQFSGISLREGLDQERDVFLALP